MKSEFGHGPFGPELGLMTTWKGTDGLALATLNSASQAPRGVSIVLMYSLLVVGFYLEEGIYRGEGERRRG